MIMNIQNKKKKVIINFIKFKGPFSLFKKIRDGDISIEMTEEEQEKFKREFCQIKSRNPKHKSEIQLYAIRNVKNLYDSRQKIVGETKGTGLMILTPKQMLQRLPIALAQVKAGSNSESLLNEIRQIVYSLYQSKQITKTVYNNIIKSIQ